MATIFAYNAVETNNFVTNPQSDVRVEAQNHVLLKPGTHFKQGAMVSVKTTDCGVNSTALKSKVASVESSKEKPISTEYLNDFIEFYPNPTSSYLNIIIKGDAEEHKVSFYDFYGKLLFSKKYPNSTSLQRIKLDLRPYADGIYYLSISVKDKVFNKKIVIKK